MKSFTIAAASSALLMGSTVLAKVTPVSVKGNAFWTGNTRFYMRGVDYQPGGSSALADPIADAAGCKRDIKQFQDLGLNTIRVYTVDNTANHDECMNALADAGIYLALDVNTPKYSLNRAKPQPSYNDVYLQNIFATIDIFAKYDNTLLFFSGNEVINDNTTTGAAPYIKAVTRDMKNYIKSRKYRAIPVGYSAADVTDNRFETAQYMNCGDDASRSDFFAFNDYSWCDPSSFQISGWDQKVALFGNYSLPLFLSEFGCNKKRPRAFNEVLALYSTQMSSVYSGGLVYEYSQEDSNYGLVDISGDSVTPESDYETLKSQFAAASNPSGDGGYKASGSASQCPPESATWSVKDAALPNIPEPAKKFMIQGAGTGPGLTGTGSQDSGTASEGSSTSTGSGSSSSGTGTSKPSSGNMVQPMVGAPFAIVAAVLISGLFGAALV